MFGFILFVSCSRNEPDDILSHRTIIVYMAADNDLSYDALNDIEEMKQGFSGNTTNLIVFVDPAGAAPYILKIGKNAESRVKSYPEFVSIDAGNMQMVLNDIVERYPAENYGLVLWSHGTSWLPAGSTLKSFGEDSGRQMNISELAEILPVRFDFILFDACLMGAVEVAYELRNQADFIVASSTEIVYTGFPYDKIIPEITKPVPDLITAATEYVDFYRHLPGTYSSATVTVIDTKELESLANAVNRLVSGQKFDMSAFDRTSVQRLDVYGEQYVFDFFDFMDQAFPEADKNVLSEQLIKTVLYKANTIRFIDSYDITTYCGLSCYIPHPGRNDLNDSYKNLEWYTAAGLNQIF
jgi:hypothetical protein